MFKSRNKIKYRRICGEEKSAVRTEIASCFEKFETIAAEYDRSDIFNFDETALFVKMVSNYSYVVSEDDRKGSKADKTRMTLG